MVLLGHNSTVSRGRSVLFLKSPLLPPSQNEVYKPSFPSSFLFYNIFWNASPSIKTEWRHVDTTGGDILHTDQTYHLTSRASQQFVTSLTS